MQNKISIYKSINKQKDRIEDGFVLYIVFVFLGKVKQSCS